jgi:uncharacterized protein DUF5996
MSHATSPSADLRGEWPALRLEEWTATRDTLHMWMQIVGKIRLARAPMVNHWWQIALYLTPRGLTTTLIPHGSRAFEIAFDFCDHELQIDLEGGERRTVALEPKSVARFYAETMAALEELGIDVAIWTKPVEVERPIPFERDGEHTAYVPDDAHRFWHQLLQADRVLKQFRGRFIGKVSPVHFFWGGMDLAVTRFSGRPAPRHPGGVPNVGDWVMVEAYSHEVSSAGFWPGAGEEGVFYAYAYPIPEGFRDRPVAPAEAFYSDEFGEFLLPYEAVRTAPDPDAALLQFLQTTYEAAAELGHWDRRALEDDPARRASPR